MADSDQRPVESLWFKHLEDIDEVYEDERKAYSLDLSYLSLVPGSIKLNGVASLVDQQGLTKFDKRGLLRRVKQPNGSSAAAPILVTGRPEAGRAAPATSGAAAAQRVRQPPGPVEHHAPELQEGARDKERQVLAEAGGHGRQQDLHAQQAKAGARFVGYFADRLSCATVVQHGWLVTYAHEDHQTWAPNDRQEVLFSPSNTNPRTVDDLVRIKAVVRYNSGSPKGDFVVLQVLDEDLDKLPDAPDVTFEVAPGEQYVLVAASARSQLGLPLSARHGNVLSAKPDKHDHIKGDTPSQKGDSGGGCFLLDGALFAINTTESDGQSALLPVAMPWTVISMLTREQLRAEF